MFRRPELVEALKAQENIYNDRTKLVRAEVEELRSALDREDLYFLGRAEAGVPIIIVGSNRFNGTAGEKSIVVVKTIVEKLLKNYLDNPRGPYHWPDLRDQLRWLQKMIVELEESLAAGRNDNVVSRAMAIGTGISRIAYWLIAAVDAAAGAKLRFDGRDNGKKNTRKRGLDTKSKVCEAARALKLKHPTYTRNRLADEVGSHFGISRHTINPWLKEIGL